MPTCKDCKFYTPIDEETGMCANLGRETFADKDTGLCPMRTFQPKE
jgi:RNA polymerase subunit RPABC4/transcription elongation factor Spt4